MCNFINVLRINFSYERRFGSFFQLRFVFVKKFVQKTRAFNVDEIDGRVTRKNGKIWIHKCAYQNITYNPIVSTKRHGYNYLKFKSILVPRVKASIPIPAHNLKSQSSVHYNRIENNEVTVMIHNCNYLLLLICKV
jgi:hypothetical protein